MPRDLAWSWLVGGKEPNIASNIKRVNTPLQFPAGVSASSINFMKEYRYIRVFECCLLLESLFNAAICMRRSHALQVSSCIFFTKFFNKIIFLSVDNHLTFL